MSEALLVRGARQLVTLLGPRGPRRGPAMNEVHVIVDGAMLIVDGVIREIGPSRRVERLNAARDAVEFDASGKVVMPGLVDGFTRLLCAPTHVQDAEAAMRAVNAFSTQRMELEARQRLRSFVREGTTTLAACCGYGMNELTEMKALRVLDGLDGRPLGIVPQLYDRTEDSRLAAEIPWKKFARTVIVPESAEALPNARRKSLGRISGEDGVITLLPGETFHQDKPHPNGRGLIDEGEAVALATGYDHISSPTCSLAAVMAIATRQMKLTPGEALVAATVNAACSIGLGDIVGSFDVGKRADLLVMNTGDYRDMAMFFGVNLVAMAMRDGEQIYPRLGTA